MPCLNLCLEKTWGVKDWRFRADVWTLQGMSNYKCKVRTRTDHESSESSTGIALLFLQPRRQMWYEFNTWLYPLYTRERDKAPVAQEAGRAAGPRKVTEIFDPTRIRSPDRPASREPLHWLSYPGPHEYLQGEAKFGMYRYISSVTNFMERSHSLYLVFA